MKSLVFEKIVTTPTTEIALQIKRTEDSEYNVGYVFEVHNLSENPNARFLSSAAIEVPVEELQKFLNDFQEYKSQFRSY